MNTKNLKNLLKTMITNKVTNATPMLWGQHGIGKSAVVQQVGQELGYKVLTIILSQKEAVDLSGVLYTYQDDELNQSVTSSHPPKWFAEAVKQGKLILFLDEFNMARREVLNAAFELVLDRRLNNIKLPESVFIVCAGNPEDERYDVTPLSESLRDRLMHIQVQPDVSAWSEWASSAGNRAIHSDVLAFIQATPSAAYADDEKNHKFPVEIKHSLRSWERLSAIHKLDLAQEIKFECYRGIVGIEIATAFMRSCAGEDMPLTAKEILKRDKKTQAKIQKWVSNGRIDLLSTSVQNLIDEIKDSTSVPQTNSDNVIAFVLDIPKDLASMFMYEIHKNQLWAQALFGNQDIRQLVLSVKEAGKKAK